jgi:hypothetical protein
MKGSYFLTELIQSTYKYIINNMKNLIFKLSCLLALNALANHLFGQAPFDLKFDVNKYVKQSLPFEGKTIEVRAYENIVYVARPVDTVYQKMNVYIPEEYFEGKSINGYSSKTAPIFFPNQIGGYMPALPASTNNKEKEGFQPIGDKKRQGMPPMEGAMPGGPRQSAILFALSKGYLVASAGARGRTTKNMDGTFSGKAPAGIVDFKAAIRYLKFNDNEMPGDANKIISNGTSAGGAMSSLLGATGNHPDYEPYLKTLGAAEKTDDIFAVSAYCPISNLDNADMAYEWQFNGINTYQKRMPMQDNSQEASKLTAKQVIVSKQLKALFPAYLNSLSLKDKHGTSLILDDKGNGTFKDLVKSYLIASAQKALDGGTDMSKYAFLTFSNGKIKQLDYDAYLKYLERQKTPPAFDALDLSSPENQEFGTASIDKQHFTKYSQENSTEKGSLADKQLIKMMNPMYYIGKEQAKTAKHWRIRHGSKDKDTGLAIPVILATYLQNKGFDVNLELPWDKPHSGDYDLAELFEWMDGICK